MNKKKKEQEEITEKKEFHTYTNVEMQTPINWAKSEGLDHHLFLYWGKELVTREEFHILRDKQTRRK